MASTGQLIAATTAFVGYIDSFSISSSGTHTFTSIASRIRVISTDTNASATLTVQRANGASWSNVLVWDTQDGAKDFTFQQPVGFEPRWRVVVSTGTFGGRPDLTLYTYGGYGYAGYPIFYAGFHRWTTTTLTSAAYKANRGLSITAARAHLMYH